MFLWLVVTWLAESSSPSCDPHVAFLSPTLRAGRKPRGFLPLGLQMVSCLVCAGPECCLPSCRPPGRGSRCSLAGAQPARASVGAVAAVTGSPPPPPPREGTCFQASH